jgi:hypothetical protein
LTIDPATAVALAATVVIIVVAAAAAAAAFARTRPNSPEAVAGEPGNLAHRYVQPLVACSSPPARRRAMERRRQRVPRDGLSGGG